MVTPELQNYIKQARAQGISDAQIRQNLLTGGWNDGDLAQAGLGPTAVPPQAPPTQAVPQTSPQMAQPQVASMQPSAPTLRPQPIQQTMTPGMYVQKKSHAGLYASIIIIFLLLGAGGGYFYYKSSNLSQTEDLSEKLGGDAPFVSQEVLPSDKDAIATGLISLVQAVNAGDTRLISTLVLPENQELASSIQEKIRGGVEYKLDYSSVDENIQVLSQNKIKLEARFPAAGVGWSVSGLSTYFVFEKQNGQWLIADTDFHEKLGGGYVVGIMKWIFIPLGLIFLFLFVFWWWMLIDCIKRDFGEKTLWILLIIFLNLLGGVLYYFLVKRKASISTATQKSHTGFYVLIIIVLLLGAVGGYVYYKGLWFLKDTVSGIESEFSSLPPVTQEEFLGEEGLGQEPEIALDGPSEPLTTSENSPVAAAPACVATPSGLVAWYPGDGSAKDIKNNNNGASQGVLAYVSGKVGQAFSLNGSTSYVQVASTAANDPTTSGSLSAWVKLTSLPSASHVMQIIGKGGDGKDFDLQINKDNKFYFYVGAGKNVYSTTIAKTGVWYHVVGTWDSTGLKMYVNGALENGNPISVTRQASGQKLEIGHQPVFAGRFLSGLIDEATIYSRALSLTEISDIYKVDSAGICKPAPATTQTTTTTPPPPAPTYFNDPLTITSVTPTSGKVGTTVTLNGKGFGKSSNSIWFYDGSYAKATALNISSADGSKLVFTIPTKLQPGSYKMQVYNGSITGEKSGFTLTVTP